MKNILVLIHDDPGQEARVQAALDVTRAVNGHLTCLDVTALVPVLEEIGVAGGSAGLLDRQREAESANRARLKPRLEAEDVSWTWAVTTDYVEPALDNAAALADLIVANLAWGEFPQPDIRSLASLLLIRVGRPVLTVPDAPVGFMAAGSALVAWDGSRQAADALEAAVPLLRLAERVTILQVEDGSVALPSEDAAAYLSRHDIHAVIVRKSGISAAEAILDSASGGLFDYLVMGAYGHSRFTEAMFGGVTRTLLWNSPIPVLLTH